MPKVLILCPTYDHVDTLYASIASVRAQHFTEWEMVVIGDGAPDRTFQIVDAITQEDPRIRAYHHPKSARYGEIYRDPVIRESEAEFVCHLSDDDIWMPDHLTQMIRLLEHAEWANQAPLRMLVGGGAEWWPINHGTPTMREAVTRHVTVSAGINYVAYRKDAYLRLPEGWTCAPWEAGTSDVYMWAKFFRNSSLSVASSAVTSAIKFPSSMGSRIRRTPEQRMAEITPWLARAAEPGFTDRICRSSSILTRMVTLFALHGAARCDNLEAAFKVSGFDPVSNALPIEPRPALNGEPMLLPLTAAQLREAHYAWVLVQATNNLSEEAESTLENLYSASGVAPKAWVKKIRALASIAGDLNPEK